MLGSEGLREVWWTEEGVRVGPPPGTTGGGALARRAAGLVKGGGKCRGHDRPSTGWPIARRRFRQRECPKVAGPGGVSGQGR